jgi:hypothetical protein
MKNPFDGQLKVVDGTEFNMSSTVPVVLNELDHIVCTFPEGWSEETVWYSLRMLKQTWESGYSHGWNEASNPLV